jgi:hypothetical protein
MGKPNYKPLLLLTAIFICLGAAAQQKFSISGTIKSFKSGETVIGATVRVDSMRVGATSNDYGFYSITLPKGSHLLEITGLGQKTISRRILLDKDQTLDFALEDAPKELKSVVVTAAAKGRSLSGTQMGVERVTIAETKNIPIIMGERDIMKVIQLLPGIKSAGDGSSGFFVRGGAADQNLVLLDEAPVYNATHLFGFFSTFNSDAIKDVNVYKGGMPAQYGGRLSSVMDVKMNDGNNKEFGASGGIGLIASRLNLEGPIQSGKSSFLISGRRTYADIFIGGGNKLYFYDLNAKLNYQLDKKNKFYLSGYFGKDELGFGKGGFGLNWGNGTATLRWNHIFNSKLFSNTSFIFSNYNYEIKIDDKATDVRIFSQIRDFNIKEELQWYPSSKHSVRVGFNAIYHSMRPGEITSEAATNINSQDLQKRTSFENALYASDTWKASNNFSVTYGARVTAFSILGKGDFYQLDKEGNVIDTMRYKGGEVVKTYLNVEPRLSASLTLGRSASIKASYVRNVQNLHLIANSGAASPTDKWVASTNIIKPGISDQVSLGFYQNIGGSKYELTIEGYYKKLQNQIDYRNGSDVFNNRAIESQLLFGEGRAYGAEFLLKKKEGKLTGWVSYTWSRSERKIDGINNFDWYRARQDRPHDLAIVASYQYNERWSFSANFIYYTGDAITFPSGKYTLGTETYFYYTERNAYRMPAYHRLDLGATRKLGKKRNWNRRFQSELSLGLYNAYGRQNAYAITFRESESNPNKTEAVQLSLFRFVPSITYNFKF